MNDNQLTQDDLQALRAPFAKEDHEELQGYWYIKEDSVMDRIESVDPSASIMIIKSETVIHGERIRANVTMTITIKGVTRTGIGSGYFMDGKKPNEPEKSAATDALKRTARLFGIGRYLLNAPSGKAFDAYLAKLGAPQTATNGATKPAPVPQTWANQDSIDTLISDAIVKLELTREQVSNALECDLSDFEYINGHFTIGAAYAAVKAFGERVVKPKGATK